MNVQPKGVDFMPRDREANERIRDDRRDLLLQHALRLFVRKGLTATRMADIAQAAGVSQGLAYHYFGSKEDIFVELIREAYGRMTAAALGLDSLPLSPAAKIELAAEKLMEGFAQGEGAALNFLLIIQASVFEAMPAEAKDIVKGRSVLHQVIARIVSEGQQNCSFRPYDSAEMAMLFWSALAGLAILRASLGEEFRVPDYRILVGMLTEPIACPKEEEE
jgi:AcrR family transcriptional regulator